MAAQFRVLGSVEAHMHGRTVDIGHVRQRSVLAVLLVEANDPVSLDQLADRIWGERPPASASASLYSYLSKLRRSLAALTGVTLLRRSAGYVLTVDPMAVDLHRFRRLVAQARTADAGRAVALFEEALGLWRGEPFAGLDTAWLCRQRESVVTERLTAELDRNDLALGHGRHAQLLAQLRTLAADNPLDERLAGQVMLALYRCGRQAEGLEAYERVRRTLRDELGADPGPALRRLHRQILTADPSLDLTADTEPPTRSGLNALAARPADRPVGASRWVSPAQLPAPPPGFTGRAAALAELGVLVPSQPDRAATVVISAIGGSGGVGKTWFALHWAHQNISRFPDGQLYVNLRGFDPAGEPLPPEVAVRGFLEALGVPAAAVPAQLDACSALYRSLTAGKRLLILLDNARDSAQVVPLLPGSPSCTVLVTSRRTLAGLVTTHGARPMVLDMLTDGEAMQLLERHLGAARVAAEPDAVSALIAHCAGLPLALGIVAARATIHAELPLAALADELRSASTRLDALDAGELTVNLRAVLSSSLAALRPDAAEVFALLGLAPGPDIGLGTVASLAALKVEQVRPLLVELVHAHLLLEPAPRRYRMHDLLQIYASELARRDPDRSRAATHRLLDHYLHSAALAAAAIGDVGEAIPLPEGRPGVSVEPIADDARALRWFTDERHVLVTAVEHAAALGFDTHAWQLAYLMQEFLGPREHWHDLRATNQTAVAAARRRADPLALTHAHRGLGRAYIGTNQFKQAQVQLRLALQSALAAGEPVCVAQAHRGLARLFARQGRFAEGLEHDQQALELFRTTGHELGQATALNAVGWHLAHLGDYERAGAHCEAAMQAYVRLGDRHGQGLTWDSLGFTRREAGQYPQSVACYERAIDLFRELGHEIRVGKTLVYLGEVHRRGGSPDRAGQVWREALRIFAEVGHPDADEVQRRLHDL